jgi:hypothetical protein
MLLIRPDAAHRVTVFGSTLKSAATSPGVSKRSLVPSIVIYSLSLMVCPQVSQKLANLATNGNFIPRFGIFRLNIQSRLKPTPGKATKSGTRLPRRRGCAQGGLRSGASAAQGLREC